MQQRACWGGSEGPWLSFVLVAWSPQHPEQALWGGLGVPRGPPGKQGSVLPDDAEELLECSYQLVWVGQIPHILLSRTNTPERLGVTPLKDFHSGQKLGHDISLQRQLWPLNGREIRAASPCLSPQSWGRLAWKIPVSFQFEKNSSSKTSVKVKVEWNHCSLMSQIWCAFILAEVPQNLHATPRWSFPPRGGKRSGYPQPALQPPHGPYHTAPCKGSCSGHSEPGSFCLKTLCCKKRCYWWQSNLVAYPHLQVTNTSSSLCKYVPVCQSLENCHGFGDREENIFL